MSVYNISYEFLSSLSDIELMTLLIRLNFTKAGHRSHIVFDSLAVVDKYYISLKLSPVPTVKGRKLTATIINNWNKLTTGHIDIESYIYNRSCKFCITDNSCNTYCHFALALEDYAINYMNIKKEELRSYSNEWIFDIVQT